MQLAEPGACALPYGLSDPGLAMRAFFHNFIAKNRTVRPMDTTHAASLAV
jgi:hypothetical protein